VGFAKRAGYEIVAEYSDDSVGGTGPVDLRPGFGAMLEHIAGNGVRVRSRFTRVVASHSRLPRAAP
jgi:DNA invertase Pin-like site-specific DNA recombinase